MRPSRLTDRDRPGCEVSSETHGDRHGRRTIDATFFVRDTAAGGAWRSVSDDCTMNASVARFNAEEVERKPGKVLIGTASWTDKSLITSGRFYPPKCSSPEDRLRYYATIFPLVEVDSSYYAMPAARVAQLWAERTPTDFTFNIKAFRLFTGHQTAPAALPKDIGTALGTAAKHVYYKDLPVELRNEMWARFREGIAPLKQSGKLAAVHFQFAPWVAFHSQNFEHIEHCQQQLAGYQLSVEFRNRSWFEGRHRAATLGFERARELVNVVVDEPQGSANSIPAVWEVTNPKLSSLRLHGRNHETWNKKGLTSSADRFNYDYSDAELGAFAEQIGAISASSVHVVFNNNYEDQGQRNARSLMAIMADDARLPRTIPAHNVPAEPT